jgi:hypothetical protein
MFSADVSAVFGKRGNFDMNNLDTGSSASLLQPSNIGHDLANSTEIVTKVNALLLSALPQPTIGMSIHVLHVYYQQGSLPYD